MDKQGFLSAMSWCRKVRRDLPLAADGAPQWSAQDWLWDNLPEPVRAVLSARPDPLADRAWFARLGARSLKRAIENRRIY